MKTGLDIYKAVQSWAKIALAGTGVTIIQAFQNGPQPERPLIAISLPTAQQFGRASNPSAYTLISGIDYSGDLSNDFEGTMSLWETGGSGDLLRALLNSLDTDAAIAHFAERGIAVNRLGDILFVPRLNDSEYIQEATTALSVRWCDKTPTTTKAIMSNVYSGAIEISPNDSQEITFNLDNQ